MISKVFNGKEYLFVEVPEDASDFKFDASWELAFRQKPMGFRNLQPIVKLNPSNNFIIGRASELTEEQCQAIARELPVGNRWENKSDYPIWFHSAKESVLSILKNEGLQSETTLIIQKQ